MGGLGNGLELILGVLLYTIPGGHVIPYHIMQCIQDEGLERNYFAFFLLASAWKLERERAWIFDFVRTD